MDCHRLQLFELPFQLHRLSNITYVNFAFSEQHLRQVDLNSFYYLVIAVNAKVEVGILELNGHGLCEKHALPAL